jgi:hypothetical protein
MSWNWLKSGWDEVLHHTGRANIDDWLIVAVTVVIGLALLSLGYRRLVG